MTTTKPKAMRITPIAVVGAELDPSLVAKLDIGDKVMLEVNGTRIYSELDCPLTSEHPWTVMSNNPPRVGQRPTDQHTIVLSHPCKSQFVLGYGNLLNLPPRQPAVFRESDIEISHDAEGKPNTLYVMLQFVSHYVAADEVNRLFEAWDRDAAELVLDDRDLRNITFTEWGEALKSLSKPGWGHRSVFRLALRAFVLPSIIDAIIEGNKAILRTLDLKQLLRIHEAIHWTPVYRASNNFAIDREVYSGHD